MGIAQAPKKIAKGSIQYWPVEVFDAFSTINSLDGLDVRFDLYLVEDDSDTEIIANGSADNSGMIALPLVDSTTLAEGLYKVFISFVASPQTPKLGPFFFQIDD